MHPPLSLAAAAPLLARSDALARDAHTRACAQTDRLFGLLMPVQWVAALVLAFVVAPRVWGADATLPRTLAFFLGGVISLGPAFLAFRYPGRPRTRYAIAVGQMLTSGLLIYLTKGRIETHFHIFGSLGILAFYRDWRVLLTATVVTALDHLVRCFVAPVSLFGAAEHNVWRVAEHAGWVVFAIVFLIKAARDANHDHEAAARQQAEREGIATQNDALRIEAEARQADLTAQQAQQAATMRQLEAQQAHLQEGIAQMLTSMDAFAEGDLTTRLDETRDDELALLFAGYNRMIGKMNRTLSEVDALVRQSATSAAQIRSAAETLSAGAGEQSHEAQEVAASVEQMTQTIIENARNAARTAEVTQENGRLAEEGSAVVHKTVEKIGSIAEVVRTSSGTIAQLGASSREIGEIISVIDDIADQTNLLALNAAIEAARAGEQGRGFAVVADEVRKLAERTTQATRQIGEMIRSIQSDTAAAVAAMARGTAEVEEGSTLADQTGVALERIVEGVNQVVEVVRQIATASEEQSSTSAQISYSVESISQVSVASAQGIGEIVHDADTLTRHTNALCALVAQFQLGASAPPIFGTSGDGYAADAIPVPPPLGPVGL